MAVPTGQAVLLDLATDAAQRAADLLLDGLGRARITVETKSTATDMVSEMDRASERLIVSTLLAARPDDGLVAEEGSASPGTSGLRWVIDPMHSDVFTATRGGGARRNGEAIACSSLDHVSTALLATGFGYGAERRRAQAQVLVELLPRIRDIRRMGAAAVDLCSVACGRVDGYFERGLAWWDLAAGGLIAAESGALVSAIDGGAAGPVAGSIVAAGPGIFNTLRDLLHSLGTHDVP